MSDEVRDTVPLTNLDQPLFDGADATKRDLVDYLDAVRDLIIGELRDRPLSVMRVRPARRPSCRRTCPSTPRPGCRRCGCGRTPPNARCPTRCATTAGPCSGSPTSAPWSTTRCWPALTA